MNDPVEYHVVSLANHPGLTCRFLKPGDFKVAPFPEETPDFSTATTFMPLVVTATQYGPMIFTVAARPSYEDGALSEWMDFLCREGKLQRGEIAETRVGKLPAVQCDAMQSADEVTMKSRIVLIEDGGRLFYLNAMAPEPLWSSALEKLQPMIDSFALLESRGSKIPLTPGSEPTAATPPPAPEVAPEPGSSSEAASPAPEAPPAAPVPTARLNDDERRAIALADDTQSFDPEHRMNANLRDRGAGLVPRVLGVDAPTKSAFLGSGSLQGILRVPFGWHVIDDGRRTLVFDQGGRIQINLSQRLHEGAALDAFTRALLDQYLEQQPDLETVQAELDGIQIAGVRNANIDGETLDQVFLVRDLGRENVYLVARVTGNRDDITRAVDLAGDLLFTFEVPTMPPHGVHH